MFMNIGLAIFFYNFQSYRGKNHKIPKKHRFRVYKVRSIAAKVFFLNFGFIQSEIRFYLFLYKVLFNLTGQYISEMFELGLKIVFLIRTYNPLVMRYKVISMVIQYNTISSRLLQVRTYMFLSFVLKKNMLSHSLMSSGNPLYSYAPSNSRYGISTIISAYADDFRFVFVSISKVI